MNCVSKRTFVKASPIGEAVKSDGEACDHAATRSFWRPAVLQRGLWSRDSAVVMFQVIKAGPLPLIIRVRSRCALWHAIHYESDSLVWKWIAACAAEPLLGGAAFDSTLRTVYAPSEVNRPRFGAQGAARLSYYSKCQLRERSARSSSPQITLVIALRRSYLLWCYVHTGCSLSWRHGGEGGPNRCSTQSMLARSEVPLQICWWFICRWLFLNQTHVKKQCCVEASSKLHRSVLDGRIMRFTLRFHYSLIHNRSHTEESIGHIDCTRSTFSHARCLRQAKLTIRDWLWCMELWLGWVGRIWTPDLCLVRGFFFFKSIKRLVINLIDR